MLLLELNDQNKKKKMKITILASLIAGSAAFAPSNQIERSSSLAVAGPNAEYANQPGVLAPLGLFDPFAILDNAGELYS